MPAHKFLLTLPQIGSELARHNKSAAEEPLGFWAENARRVSTNATYRAGYESQAIE